MLTKQLSRWSILVILSQSIILVTSCAKRGRGKCQNATTHLHSGSGGSCTRECWLIKRAYRCTGSRVISINQTSTAPISPVTPGSVARQAQSVFNSKIEETIPVTSTGHQACWYLWGNGQVKEICLQTFLQGSNWNSWTDRQWEVVPKRRGTGVKSSCTCFGLDLRDRQTIIVVWSPVNGMEVMRQAWSEDKQAVFHAGFCRSTNWS